MHPDLSGFTNKFFYNNKLKTAALPHQTGHLVSGNYLPEDELTEMLADKRMVFIPSTFSARDISEKHNPLEAGLVSKVLEKLLDIHGFISDEEIVNKVGIITPYRNQIAAIREQLERDGFSCFNTIQVDTVERYQGSQKDFILVSFCMNRPSQLDFLIQSRVQIEDKSDGEMLPVVVDRKLNVTLTRARKQLILTGNEAVLGYDGIYGPLIEDIRKNGGYYQKGARAIVGELE